MTADHWSHSAYQEYSDCGEAYRLKRIVRVPDPPMVAGVGGSAFHTWTDNYDVGVDLHWEDALELTALNQEEKYGFPRAEWRVFGKGRTALGDLDNWRDVIGPDLIEKYIAWRNDEALTLMVARDLPADANGNTTGMEYALEFNVRDTLVTGYVDRIFHDIDSGDLLVVDTKTGTRKPQGAQLPTYLVGLRKAGVNVATAAYYDARKGVMTPPKTYTGWDEERLAALYDQAAYSESQGIYLPRLSEDCGFLCSVRKYCAFAL